MARDRLGGSSFLEEMIHIQAYLLRGHLRKRQGSPFHEVIEDVPIALEGVGRVVFSLQGSPVADQLNILHRPLLSR